MKSRTIWTAVAAMTAARIAYNVLWSPYELVSDEAQYWDWSRRLDSSYYSKGPGIAWLIAAATHALGSAEWAIRTPAAVAFGVVMAALAWLTADALGHTPGGLRAAAFAPLIVTLIPAYQLLALMMTIDAPYLACWALALCAGWRVYQLERESNPSYTSWIVLGAAVGVGFLFKYTALLVVPGLLWFAWIARRDVPWKRAWVRALLACVVALAAMMPVFVWNARNGAAGARHLLGYLKMAGGDRPIESELGLSLLAVVEYPLVQFAVIGPAIVLAFAGVRTLGRGTAHDRSSRFAQFAWCTAAPTLAAFLVASVRTTIQANWPVAAFVSLIPLAAIAVADGGVRRWWWGTVIYGVAAAVVIHCPLAAARVPVVGRLVPVHRFHGARAQILELGGGVHDFLERSAGHGLIVAVSHNEAGLLAYYLPGRPVVASAGRFLGDRPSAYDFFSDTDLNNPALAGRPALFMGGTAEQWLGAFKCPDLRMVSSTGPQFETRSFAR